MRAHRLAGDADHRHERQRGHHGGHHGLPRQCAQPHGGRRRARAGQAFSLTAMANLVVATVAAGDVGIATGINGVMRTVGMALGSAMSAGILASGSRSGLPTDHAYAVAFAWPPASPRARSVRRRAAARPRRERRAGPGASVKSDFTRRGPPYAEAPPPSVQALRVERAAATVPDREHRPDPEADAGVFGDGCRGPRTRRRPSTRQDVVDVLRSSVISRVRSRVKSSSKSS